MTSRNKFDSSKAGEKLILSAIKTDEALADLLKVEVSKMKKLLKSESSIKDIQYSSDIIRKIIFAMSITEDKIRQGIELCQLNKE